MFVHPNECLIAHMKIQTLLLRSIVHRTWSNPLTFPPAGPLGLIERLEASIPFLSILCQHQWSWKGIGFTLVSYLATDKEEPNRSSSTRVELKRIRRAFRMGNQFVSHCIVSIPREPGVGHLS